MKNQISKALFSSMILGIILIAGVGAQADPVVTNSSCTNAIQGTVAAIQVVRDQDAEGKTVRTLNSYLAFYGLPVSKAEVNCKAGSCEHVSGADSYPQRFVLYPHFLKNSDVITSITMETFSPVAIYEDELSICKVISTWPPAEVH